MADNHTTSIEIKYGVNSQGYFSRTPAKNLIVFVHGLKGRRHKFNGKL
jgi:hypothetical protein